MIRLRWNNSQPASKSILSHLLDCARLFKTHRIDSSEEIFWETHFIKRENGFIPVCLDGSIIDPGGVGVAAVCVCSWLVTRYCKSSANSVEQNNNIHNEIYHTFRICLFLWHSLTVKEKSSYFLLVSLCCVVCCLIL